MSAHVTPDAGAQILAETESFLSKMSLQRQFIVQYRNYHKKIHSYFSLRLRGDTMLADDLTSAVFMKAFANFSDYNDDFAFSTWVYTIARNQLTDYFRHQNRRPTVSLEHAEDLPDDEVLFYDIMNASLSVDRIKTLLRELPEAQSKAVYLRHFLLKEIAEVASALGKTEEATRQLISRGCRKLKVLLEVDT